VIVVDSRLDNVFKQWLDFAVNRIVQQFYTMVSMSHIIYCMAHLVSILSTVLSRLVCFSRKDFKNALQPSSSYPGHGVRTVEAPSVATSGHVTCITNPCTTTTPSDTDGWGVENTPTCTPLMIGSSNTWRRPLRPMNEGLGEESCLSLRYLLPSSREETSLDITYAPVSVLYSSMSSLNVAISSYCSYILFRANK